MNLQKIVTDTVGMLKHGSKVVVVFEKRSIFRRETERAITELETLYKEDYAYELLIVPNLSEEGAGDILDVDIQFSSAFPLEDNTSVVIQKKLV
jgi:hypothetical protein